LELPEAAPNVDYAVPLDIVSVLEHRSNCQNLAPSRRHDAPMRLAAEGT